MEQCWDVIEIVCDSDQLLKLDAFIASKTTISKTRAHKLIRSSSVSVNSKVVSKAGYQVKRNDIIAVPKQRPTKTEDPTDESAESTSEAWKSATLLSEEIPIEVVFEDDHVIVINKAKGMAVHPSPFEQSGTLVNALIGRVGLQNLAPSDKEPFRPGIVHRLDKDTTGLLVVAKTSAAAKGLFDQFFYHTASRVYWCIVHHPMKEDTGTIDVHLVRHPTDHKIRTAAKQRQQESTNRALTHWKVLERYGDGYLDSLCLVECRLETGKTHQIRAHMKHIHHPLLNDTDYGGLSEPETKKDQFMLCASQVLEQHETKGQVLHALELRFTHPITNEKMHFSAPLPNYFQELLDRLRVMQKRKEESSE